MNFTKIRNTLHRPNDYLKERNIKSIIKDRSSFGTSLIGWESNRLRENSKINGNHKATLLYLDSTNKNHFIGQSGKFANTIDRELGMKRGFPFNKLDKRRQKKLIKNVDILLSKINSRVFQ